MTLWILLTLMTVTAVAAVLWPLSRHRTAEQGADSDTQFYRDQIAEIDRDRERGLLSEAEAEAARAEAGRRLLRAQPREHGRPDLVGEPALRRRRAVSALALSLVPLLALAVYGAFGSPHLASSPQAARPPASADQLDFASALARIEQHLAQRPDDGRGWEVVAPVYMRLGRAEDAARAYEAALRLIGPDADRLANYGEALVAVQDGIVPAEARTAFEKAQELDRSHPKPRFYLARAAEQDGNRDKAKAEYGALLASSPADAPWVPVVREQLARLDGTAPPPAPDREAILGMVQGLADRLDAQGGSAEEWSRLLRSYAVLGQPDKAKAALSKARQALAGDQGAVQRVEAMARDLKITDDSKP
ncbi:MAG TPA: c-type cytochrome biogenesis protein CcmI [Microvirga sp.]|jgi:cytochrome c-type biogenesis protein CcmH|nr:c-type cytochrome biogenesis protein CcmI [Microvirga sp.]